ncbi:Dam family site-specific DNA-(adenine-N6)-methyltransferase [Halorubrum sp. CBA1229]|uniref:DNA adenine methylase n=1 Tax=Halorubrum sp. CBA1229 TaxID=1853699 RepID=UPI000F3E2D1A|nr:Dam family site-specific DNA-(adenine-N6)-methyltransferase [Halorubrum sp. CBA1229]QKY16862.1 Dam family site-specific DNA-(adenine-N6)-methyltransferase [Halorubrum sp. CBA1229]
MAEPILKWVGGKRQLLQELRAHFPISYEEYHEPFIGGGAVFFEMEPTEGSINDLNRRLITFYEVIRDYPEDLIEENQRHRYEEGYYYDARDRFNELHQLEERSIEQEIEEASLMLYLNRTGYNGLYRVNQSNEFNVPFGTHRNPDFVRERQIRKASAVLEHIEIYNRDFSYLKDRAAEGDLVYFDPPYEPVSQTADFTEYQSEGFNKDDQRRLRDLAEQLSNTGVNVVISNSPPVWELYQDIDEFDVSTVGASRMINSDPDNRDDVAEVIITNVAKEDQQQQDLGNYV